MTALVKGSLTRLCLLRSVLRTAEIVWSNSVIIFLLSTYPSAPRVKAASLYKGIEVAATMTITAFGSTFRNRGRTFNPLSPGIRTSSDELRLDLFSGCDDLIAALGKPDHLVLADKFWAMILRHCALSSATSSLIENVNSMSNVNKCSLSRELRENPKAEYNFRAMVRIWHTALVMDIFMPAMH